MGNHGTYRQFCFQISGALLCLMLGACALSSQSGSEGQSYVLDCVIPNEQANSLQGRWASAPIKVALRDGTFNSDEAGQVTAAVNTWNDLFTASKGGPILALGANSQLNQTVPNCSGSAPADGTVIYKRAGGWSKSAAAVAVTTMCITPANFTFSNGSGNLSRITNAIMELNYTNYFVQGSGRYPNLQTIAIHELGHLLGLDHSCGALKNGQPNVGCPDINNDPSHPLFLTVMFPQVFFDQNGTGEIKNSLDANDQGRANCLY